VPSYEADEDDNVVDGEEEDDPSGDGTGGLTPLSISPGSRSGSHSRRTSVSLQSLSPGLGTSGPACVVPALSGVGAGAAASGAGGLLINTTATRIGG
jgi:hypothetical protein